MLTLTAGSPLATAMLRGVYLALGSFAVAFLPAYAVTDDLKGPLIAGAMAALWALGFQGGMGQFDANRAARNDIRDSDVPVAAPAVQVIEPPKA